MEPKLPDAIRPAEPRRTGLLADEDGAVTADWVVITSVLAGLGVAVITTIANYISPNADNLDTFLTDYEISERFE